MKFYDGTVLLGTVATGSTGSTATFPISTLALGPHQITAVFGGDSTNSPSTSAVLTETVKQSSTVTLSSNLMPSKVGQSITFSATVTGASVTPGGSVVFNDNGTQIGAGAVNGSGVASFSTNLLAAGTHPVTAVYSGDAETLTGTSAALSQAVNLWSTSTILSSNAATSALGSTVVFSVHVATTSMVAPTGAVVLTDGGATVAMLVVDGSGNASYSTSSLAVGTHALVASYQADSTNDASSSAPLAQTVQTIGTSTVLTSSANPVSAGATLHLVATIGAVTNAAGGVLTGAVTFKDGATTLGTATISQAGVGTLDVTSLGVGTHALDAVYGGATNYGSSTSNTVSEVVQLATTSVQLTSSNNPSISGKGVTLTAVVSGSGGVPGGTVTFLNGGATVGTGYRRRIRPGNAYPLEPAYGDVVFDSSLWWRRKGQSQHIECAHSGGAAGHNGDHPDLECEPIVRWRHRDLRRFGCEQRWRAFGTGCSDRRRNSAFDRDDERDGGRELQPQ